MKIVEGFLLGLSTGTSCIMSCYPLIFPFLFIKIEGIKKNNIKLLLFIIGRLISYILIGAIIGFLGFYTLKYIPVRFQINIKRISWIIAGIILFINGVSLQFPKSLFCQRLKFINKQNNSTFMLGILAGLNLCPPFLTAASRVFALPSDSGLLSIFHGIVYFILFFFGTTIFFIPLFAAGFFNKVKEEIKSLLEYIARFTLIILGIYFFFFEGLIFFLQP
ncbi:MAG: sulfite exporter TauE/SafE family protein [Spirochaetales bacterium]|jgi:sulfite exporter TauE/SafE|nr:sulfite exporter TauE/SafE family protein [Exilispira sp.]NMC67303.1 sulfite exporter TauE/SafE family protein [Spirochaetales bacterium]